ncbi:hypothetical protein J3A83DRAFT_4370475 [Scleroderma citrinum]
MAQVGDRGLWRLTDVFRCGCDTSASMPGSSDFTEAFRRVSGWLHSTHLSQFDSSASSALNRHFDGTVGDLDGTASCASLTRSESMLPRLVVPSSSRSPSAAFCLALNLLVHVPDLSKDNLSIHVPQDLDWHISRGLCNLRNAWNIFALARLSSPSGPSAHLLVPHSYALVSSSSRLNVAVMRSCASIAFACTCTCTMASLFQRFLTFLDTFAAVFMPSTAFGMSVHLLNPFVQSPELFDSFAYPLAPSPSCPGESPLSIFALSDMVDSPRSILDAFV